MILSSLSYFLFLPLVFLIQYFTRERYRCFVLLGASYAFYAGFKAPQLLLVLLLVTAISYNCGLWLGREPEESKRKKIFWLGTLSCLLILAVTKYLPIFLNFDSAPVSETLLISIGVSYFIFQAISYLADIYLEVLEPEQSLRYHALSLAFFPKLLQGPIERGGDLLPQLKTPYVFDYYALRSGVLLFAWGLFKKVVIADRLALYANAIYSDVHLYKGLPLIIGTYAYALQIYFDFASYTDMARGTARIFGINLSQNFNSPYLATSVADFWRRWHMSFSRWILDYIFKPLQMTWRNQGQSGTAMALIVTFLVSGIWHGATWGFVIWGLLHGIYLACSTYYRPYQKKLHKKMGVEKSRLLKIVQIVMTFHLVTFAWIFFRADHVNDAIYVIKNMTIWDGGLKDFLLEGGKKSLIILPTTLTVLLLAAVYPQLAVFIEAQLEGRKRWLIYYALVMLIFTCGLFGKGFIYGAF